MKSKLITLVMALLLSISALADGGNSVYIDQTNADNSTVSITQTGSNNQVGDFGLNNPFLLDGNAMSLVIQQDGMNNSITGNFIGGDSSANLFQSGNLNSTNLNMGNFGTNSGKFDLSVTGSNNTTNLNIATTNSAANYDYKATINGSNLGGAYNNLTSNVNSTYVKDTFMITGDHNTVTTTQIGASGTSLVSGHKINTSILGSNNDLTITQDGSTIPNNVTVNVTGNLTSTTITQH